MAISGAERVPLQRDGKATYQRLQNHLESDTWDLDDELDTAFLVFMRGGPGVDAVPELILVNDIISN